ncbi:hypothetical protein [Haloferula sp.]|uniref:hypothetical protein n=1 Tax=Haloferula sp. TaxID=2497595 RepID=UPI003C7639B4
MEPYRPSIRRLQLEFAQRLARARMLRKLREKNPNPNKAITDNSEPWLENPSTIGDFLEISRLVGESAKKWRKQFNNSSTS